MNREIVKKVETLDELVLQVQNIVNELNRLMKLAKDNGLDLEVYVEGNEKNPIFPVKERYVATLTKIIS